MEIDSAVWDRLVTAAVESRSNAYAPYSNFPIGAALWVGDGQIVAGCNVENVSFPCGQCAEANAAGSMISTSGHTTIHAVVVAAISRHFVWPCGRCRQILAEFSGGDTPVMAVTLERRSAPVLLAELLPNAFESLD